MSMNSPNTSPNSAMEKQIVDLMLDAIRAYNEDDHERANNIMERLRAVRKMCPDCKI